MDVSAAVTCGVELYQSALLSQILGGELESKLDSGPCNLLSDAHQYTNKTSIMRESLLYQR